MLYIINKVTNQDRNEKSNSYDMYSGITHNIRVGGGRGEGSGGGSLRDVGYTTLRYVYVV